MSTQIHIRDDQTLEVKWTGRRGGGSLFQLAAEGNAKNANKLDADELWAVCISAQQAPFPCGKGEHVYRRFLQMVRETPELMFTEQKLPDTELGKLRAVIVTKAGSGFNAPHDSYLSIAVAVKEGTSINPY